MRHIILATIIAGLFLSSLSFGYSGGGGTSGDPYQIANKTDLLALAATTADYNKCFILTADINMGGQVFTAAIIASDTSTSNDFQGTAFTGIFDGNGHKITYFTINGESNNYLGLFGYIGAGSQIKNLGIENFSASNSPPQAYVSGLVGANYGSINNCYSTGAASGFINIGGLVGYNGGSIDNCYSTVSASGFMNVGGLVGFNNGSINKCYSRGSVIATGGNVGGIVGYRETYGSVLVSFWDTQTSGQTTSEGGTGKTTAEMKTLLTFTSAGWDFSTTDGDAANWYMPAADYPILAWQMLLYVPDVIGMTQTEAESVITSSGFGVGTVTTVSSESVPAGDIVSQSPGAGTLVSIGSVINLVVSLGPVVTVPDVVGMLQSNAQSAIISAGLSVGTVTIVSSESVPAGHVINQIPVGGIVVDSGSAVNLVVSLGAVVTVPDVVGMLQADAQSAITSAGLSVGTVTAVFSVSVPAGNVISQSPVGGTLVNPGSSINLVVSMGQSAIVPDVAGMSQAAAESALITVGLAVGTTTNSYDYAVAVGNVANQSPTAGTEVAVGSVVNLIISLGRGGNGTSGNPYPIASKAGLLTMAATIADYNKCFILTADIDMGGQVFTTAIIASGTAFTGIFDGNGHKITHFTINGAGNSNVGLFGQVSTPGIVKNIGVENFVVSGSSNVGGLVGNNSPGTVSNCYATGSVSGGSSIGGLVGYNFGSASITSCYAAGSVSGTGNNIGGLVGKHELSDITSCHASGSVNGSSYVGGLVGYQGQGGVTMSYATSSIGGISYVGGLVGENLYGSISSCYAGGSVSGTGNYVGGLVGLSGNKFNTLTNCYSSCSVIGSSYAGGLVGAVGESTINNCYSIGSVSGSSSVGGLVGVSGLLDSISNSFWDTETSGQTTSSGGTGKTTTQMKTLSTFTDWDFSTIWDICEGTNYPRLSWQIPAGDWVCPDGVNTEDLDYFVGQWLDSDCTTSNDYCGGVDVNSSGTVDLTDYAIFAEHWLEGV